MRVTEINSAVETDQRGNVSAFITVDSGERGLLRKKPPFPNVGDELPGYSPVTKVSQAGNEYIKFEKGSGSPNGSQNGSRRVSQDGPDEAYWAGQNAAKGRSAAQARALQYMQAKGIADFKLDDDFRKVIAWFAEDTEAAQKRAVERAAAQQREASHTGSSGGDRVAPPPSEPQDGRPDWWPPDRPWPGDPQPAAVEDGDDIPF